MVELEKALPDFLATAGVGSYPRPEWLAVPFMGGPEWQEYFHGRKRAWRVEEEFLPQALDDATTLAVREQEEAGLDIVSDGEQRRVHYLLYYVEKLRGVDFKNRVLKPVRGGKNTVWVPRILGELERPGPMALRDVQYLRSLTHRRIKMTIGGPMTTFDTLSDAYYKDEEAACLRLAEIINEEVREWVKAGVDLIQVDEPTLIMYPDKVRRYGMKALERSLQGLSLPKVVHICYGYPLGPAHGKNKPRPHGYSEILPLLADSSLDLISLEFEAPRLDPSLLRECPGKGFLLGLIDVGSREVETPGHVADRLREALRHLPPERLYPAPDCGLACLEREVARKKLRSLVEGTRVVRRELGRE